MPFIKSYIDKDTGAYFENSFWWPGNFTVDYLNKILSVEYVAHLSTTAQYEGKRPLPYRKRYQISGNEFTNFIQALLSEESTENEPLPVKISSILDLIALSVLDYVNDAEETVSFFSDAVQIPVDLAVAKSIINN